MLETASIEQLKAIDNWALFNESGPRVFFRTWHQGTAKH